MVRHATDAMEVQPKNKAGAVKPAIAPNVKRALTSAVAQELQKIHGGNEVLDWLEAEILVDCVLKRDGLARG